MINENTLKVLNKAGIGADIDSLESHIIDFKQARLLSNLAFYDVRFSKLYKILKEIKPSSLALSDKVSLNELDNTDKFDKLFEKYKNIYPDIAYGTQSININSMKNNIDSSVNKVVDITALTNVDGIDIRCTYINGYVYRIYAIGETKSYIDLTEEIKDKVPEYIDDIHKYELVELRGKITIFKKYSKLQKYSQIIPCSVIRCVRTKTHLQDLNIVFNDIIIDAQELPYSNQWDKMEYMRSIGLSVPHYSLIRNVDRENLEQALIELDNYFNNIKLSNEMIYNYTGIIIRFNDDLICSALGNSVIYNSRDLIVDEVYHSIVKSISTSIEDNILKQHINIVKVKCNDNLIIDCIDIDDIYQLEKYSISIGKRVYFKIIEDKAILCKPES